jgi:xanthine/uracil permease
MPAVVIGFVVLSVGVSIVFRIGAGRMMGNDAAWASTFGLTEPTRPPANNHLLGTIVFGILRGLLLLVGCWYVITLSCIGS